MGNNFSQTTSASCGVTQGSILDPLLFFIYVNYKSQAVKCDLFFYANDTCLVCQHKDINKIENELHGYFCTICDWFVDNKLIIHFGEVKIKLILFASKFKRKNIKTSQKIWGYTN